MQRVLQFYREAEEEGKTIYDSIPHMHSIECANNKIPDVWGLPGGVWLDGAVYNFSANKCKCCWCVGWLNGNLIYSNTQL